MTDDEIKVLLRWAVSERLIAGWYRHLPIQGRCWVVNPMIGRCRSWTRNEMVEYARMIQQASGL